MIQYLKHLYAVSLFVLMVPVIWGQDTVTDIDGNVYQTVQIGDQLWMKENLKVTHYNNGDEIPTGYSNFEWADLDETETGAYAVYDDNESNADTYGYLYNWYAVETGNLAPEGWNVPTDEEWTVLKDFIANDGYTGIDGNALKEIGYDHWYDYGNPDDEGLDIYGFTGLPGGYRSYYSGGNYNAMGYFGYFWSSTEYGSGDAWNRLLGYNTSAIYRYDNDKGYGFSVRCIRDSIFLSIKPEVIIPEGFALHQNYPNPFNPITSLRYDLPEQAQVTLTIYDLMGRAVTQLVNTTQKAGYRSVQWNATDNFGKPVSAGVYLYQIRAGEFVQTKKMVLLK